MPAAKPDANTTAGTVCAPHALYVAVQREDGWTVELNHADLGLRASLDEAVETAVRAAADAHQRGHYAHAMIRLDDGNHTLWLNGSLA